MPEFEVYECPNCMMQFVEPRAESHGVYEDIYAHADLVPGYERYALYAIQVKRCKDPASFLESVEPAYWAVFQALQRHQQGRREEVLEVGSGLGYLTYAINNRNMPCVGIDVSEESVRKARSEYGSYFTSAELGDFKDESFSAIILCEVIEHVADPLTFLREVVRLLKRGGIVVITTPNRDAHLATSIWQTDLPPVHFTWFTSAALKELATALNLKYESIDLAEYERKWPSRMKRTPESGPPTSSVLDGRGFPRVSRRSLLIMRARAIANGLGVFFPLLLAAKRFRALTESRGRPPSSYSTRRQAAAVFTKP